MGQCHKNSVPARPTDIYRVDISLFMRRKHRWKTELHQGTEQIEPMEWHINAISIPLGTRRTCGGPACVLFQLSSHIYFYCMWINFPKWRCWNGVREKSENRFAWTYLANLDLCVLFSTNMSNSKLIRSSKQNIHRTMQDMLLIVFKNWNLNVVVQFPFFLWRS
jgi:hypothetical protein